MTHVAKPQKADFVVKAREAWGEKLPDWVLVLAEDATLNGLAGAAKTIGYSAGLVSYVLANKYAAGIDRIEAKVRGALMGAVVGCPVLGEIGRDHCLDEQAKPRLATSSVRSRLYRACRSGCPHSRLKETPR